MKDITQKLQMQVQNLTNQLHYRDEKLLSFENAAHEMMMVNVENRTQITIRNDAIAEQEQIIKKLEGQLQEKVKELNEAKKSPPNVEKLEKEIDRLARVNKGLDAELALLVEANEELRNRVIDLTAEFGDVSPEHNRVA